jgi:hypothetical protein
LVQYDFTAGNIVARLNEIIAEGPARQKMIAGLAGVKASLRLSGKGQLHPVERAAEEVLTIARVGMGL